MPRLGTFKKTLRTTMFKNISIFRIACGFDTPASTVGILFNTHQRFAPCGATQDLSVGWIEPRGIARGPLFEVINGQWLLKLRIETKAVPAAVIKRRTAEVAAGIESNTGRKPGKKELHEIAENVTLDLLPRAFPKQSEVLVWIDPKQNLLVLGTTSKKHIDLTLSALADLGLSNFEVAEIETCSTPSKAMASWINNSRVSEHFCLDGECELKAVDGRAVRYVKKEIATQEACDHITSGLEPKSLALFCWHGEVSFVLTDTMQLKKIKLMGRVFVHPTGEPDHQFDADVAIATGELSTLIPDLIDAIGGEKGSW